MDHKYYFIGIGGVGMSALAHCLIDAKKEVLGTDQNSNDHTKSLLDKGALICKESAACLPEDAVVVYSSSIGQTHPLMIEAKDKRLTCLHRSDLLALLSQQYCSFAVAGTHGKTSTTSMFAHLLTEAKLDPAYAIGGIYEKDTGKLGLGKHFVFEADESDGSLVKYHPFGAIITNIDFDHMDFYGSKEKVISTFETFLNQIQSQEHIVYCLDDPILQTLNIKGTSYGFSTQAEARIIDYQSKGWGCDFEVAFQNQRFKLHLPLPGKHNVLNATAAFIAALKLGASSDLLTQGLSSFPGIRRRLDHKFTLHNIECFDDYAHHPVEIKATLAALREAYPYRRLVGVFQPHRHSRFDFHYKEFVKSLDLCDQVIVTDVYACGEKKGICKPQNLVELLHNKHQEAKYIENSNLCETLAQELRPHDVVVTLGAGDITQLGVKLKQAFVKNPPALWKVGIVFGGLSPEHAISLQTAQFIYESLDSSLHEVKFFLITPQGVWLTHEQSVAYLENQTIDVETPLSQECLQQFYDQDFLIPIFHGPYGEDGIIQGFLELLQKPYSGSGVLPAAISNDKVLCKKIAQSIGVQTPLFIDLTRQCYQTKKEAIAKQVEDLGYPVFVKPNKVGSSLGISKVKNAEELFEAIEKALDFDYHILIEKAVERNRELGVSLLGNHAVGFQVGDVGEWKINREFNDFENKYGCSSTYPDLAPNLTKEKLLEIQTMSQRLCEQIHNTGFMRIDFLLDQDHQWWFLEMNAIPGMQAKSIFPKAWESRGYSHQDLMNEIVILGFHQYRRKKALRDASNT